MGRCNSSRVIIFCVQKKTRIGIKALGIKRFLTAFLIGLLVAHPIMLGSGEPPRHQDYVILLHGLGRSRFSMKRLEWVLEKEGYRVINQSYPSTRRSVETIASSNLEDLLKIRASDHTVKIHFIPHSLGN